jgi:hypothetical protein
MVPLLWLALLLYPGLVIAWLVLEYKRGRFRLWLGLAAILLAAPFFTVFGMFLSAFDSNTCYSQAIREAAELQSKVTAGKAGRVDQGQSIAGQLPLYGYETSCAAVRESLARLREIPSGAPNKP